MAKKTFTPEQIVNNLRQVEVLVSKGKTVPPACVGGRILVEGLASQRGVFIVGPKSFPGMIPLRRKRRKEML